ncbi:hypothetical protein [Sporosarcina beigongshangi]|uniref:hypothetical protein n=1 Tax=Sporosarcina beigongshangi TaxID=2782538 RepID=UPI00193A2CA3|nr:hypothetical protein [Sporosarcina beigongshangi]
MRPFILIPLSRKKKLKTTEEQNASLLFIYYSPNYYTLVKIVDTFHYLIGEDYY